MRTGSKNRVTSLQYEYYDPVDYTLDPRSNLSLNAVNKILLNLFNNDLYAYTMLVGKVKGVWWKYWFNDNAMSGYDSADMVCVNAIDEITFLKKYWHGLKDISDTVGLNAEMPTFKVNDDGVVKTYLNELANYVHIGNRKLSRQLLISLKENNKDLPTVTSSWQPYLVTEEELQKREYLLSNLLEKAIETHVKEFHAYTDALDDADHEYEKEGGKDSLYDDDLLKYLPTKAIEGKESETWVAYTRTKNFNKLLGLTRTAFDFLHIVKPLGDAIHRLESWVRTDGHVTVKGYVPTQMLTELIPDKGTLEYNRWKTGGMKRYAFRFDYPINNALSKLHFADKKEEEDDGLFGAPIKKIEFKKRDSTSDKTDDYSRQFAEMNSMLSSVTDSFADLQDNLSQYNPSEETNTPHFPASTDQWCKGEHMVYPPNSINTSKIESLYITTRNVPFQFNPDAISGTSGGKRYLIDPKYKKDSSIVGLINPFELLSDTKNKSMAQWAWWDLLVDMTDKNPEDGTYTRTVVLQLKGMSTATLEDLIYWNNSDVKNMTSSTDARLGDFLENDCVRNPDFKITRYEIRQIEETFENHPLVYEQRKMNTVVINGKDTEIPDYDDHGKPKYETINVRGTLNITYQVISDIEAAAELKEDPVSDNPKADQLASKSLNFTDTVIRDTDELMSKPYTILNYKQGLNGSVLFYPDRCVNEQGDKVPLLDILTCNNTAHDQAIEEGNVELFEDLFNTENYDHSSSTSSAGSTVIEMHNFIKVPDERPSGGDTPSPIDTDPEDDLTIIASDVRLTRDFGMTRSPALKSVTSCIVMPDSGTLMTPSFIGHPTAYLSTWTWRNGQSVVFSVPSSTENIAFEISGAMKTDNVDLSVHELRKQERPDAQTFGDLTWLMLVMRYAESKARLTAAIEDGYQVLEDGGLLRPISDEVKLLLKNSATLMDGLTEALTNDPNVTLLMQLRTLSTDDRLTSIMATLESESDALLAGGSASAGLEKLSAIHDLLQMFADYNFRFKSMYYLYSELISSVVTTDETTLVMIPMIHKYLNDNPFYMESTDSITALINEVENLIPSLVSSGHLSLTEQLNSALSSLKSRLTEYEKNRALLDRPIPVDPVGVEPSDERKAAEAALLKKFCENMSEVSVYVQEILDNGDKVKEMRKLIRDYLDLEPEDDVKAYLEYKSAQLEDSTARYVVNNTNICRGYISYVTKWYSVFSGYEHEEGFPDCTAIVASLKHAINEDLPGMLED